MNEEKHLAEREEAIALYDVYQKTLTAKQRALFSDYYLYDLSLSEIAENHAISRAGVNDSLKKSLLKMRTLEKELGVIEQRKALLSEFEKLLQIPSEKEKETAFAKILEDFHHGI
jgi:predicted DNA-binding protein YlxM (UPF0122 family)